VPVDGAAETSVGISLRYADHSPDHDPHIRRLSGKHPVRRESRVLISLTAKTDSVPASYGACQVIQPLFAKTNVKTVVTCDRRTLSFSRNGIRSVIHAQTNVGLADQQRDV
jgi:hypothetical protein